MIELNIYHSLDSAFHFWLFSLKTTSKGSKYSAFLDSFFSFIGLNRI